ncbi:hypothetical protein DL95DRAFT_521561 [Leptodontidium sp. 2 PMI_412]|nr:hypothetical protein DL95DRAFT_521561 [Leptodontidium sp. 2 PMI_412]
MSKQNPIIETSSPISPSSSTSPSKSNPQTKPEDPSPTEFYTIIANNSKLYNLSLIPSDSTFPLYHITNSSFTPKKPDVTLTSKTASGPVLGVIKLSALSDNVVGLGDPSSLTGERDVQWERFKSMKDWSHGRYEFDFVDGETGQRRIFTWRRTRQGLFDDQPDMELAENVGGRSGGEAELGEVLAVYKGCQGFFSRVRGRFFLRRGWRVRSLREGGGKNGGEGGGQGDVEGAGDWEVMVLLTGCGAIETARRRSRARRGAGGGGGAG